MSSSFHFTILKTKSSQLRPSRGRRWLWLAKGGYMPLETSSRSCLRLMMRGSASISCLCTNRSQKKKELMEKMPNQTKKKTRKPQKIWKRKRKKMRRLRPRGFGFPGAKDRTTTSFTACLKTPRATSSSFIPLERIKEVACSDLVNIHKKLSASRR